MNQSTRQDGQPATSTEPAKDTPVCNDKYALLKFALGILTGMSFIGEPYGVPSMLALMLATLYFGLVAHSEFKRRSIFGVVVNSATLGVLLATAVRALD